MDNCSATPPSDASESNLTVPNVNVDTSEHGNPESDEPVHPYLEDIMKCPCNEWQLTKADPVPYKSLEDFPFTIIDTKQLLLDMMEKMTSEKEIAINTKRAKYDSFEGKSCLIQVATHSQLYLVDTIALKDDIIVLNEILTSTNVLKVTNMKENFIENLQKDLGLYLVNMFCLGIAWKALNPTIKKKETVQKRQSVAGLLKDHCGIDFRTIQIEYQKKDQLRWDERPLTDDQVKYLRLETQYLLHVYQKFRNSLIDNGLLNQVYQECHSVCKTVWYPGKHKFDGKAYIDVYRRMAAGGKLASKMKPLDRIQMEVFKALYEWRYNTAMKHNENCMRILRDFSTYQIAYGLPEDAGGIYECLAKASHDESSPDILSPLLVENIEVVCELIAKVVQDMSGSPGAKEEVPFRPDTDKSADSRKRKNQDAKCPTCGKYEHNVGDTCSQKKQKKRLKQQEQERQQNHQKQKQQQKKRPSHGRAHFNAQNTWRYEQQSYPMNPLRGHHMNPMMGSRMGFMGYHGMYSNELFGNRARMGWQHQRFRY